MAFVYAQKRLMNGAVGGNMYKNISIGFSDICLSGNNKL